MWKVSVLYVVFALALIGSLWIGEKTLMQRMVGKELDLPQEVWKRLTWFWGLGFVAIAIVNGYYVRLALAARENLFAATTLDKKIELTELDCVSFATDTVVQFCQNAQQKTTNQCQGKYHIQNTHFPHQKCWVSHRKCNTAKYHQQTQSNEMHFLKFTRFQTRHQHLQHSRTNHGINR
jgi:hypothetical protein